MRASAIPRAIFATSPLSLRARIARGIPLIVDNTVRHPNPVAAHRARRGYRCPLADEIHRRPRNHSGRRDRRQRALPLGGARPRAFPCSTNRTSPTTASSTPSVSAHSAYLERARSVYLRTTGAVLAPFSAFLLLQGLETLALRVERHVENARKVAEFLRTRSTRRMGQLCRLSRQPLLCAGRRNILAAARPRSSHSASREALSAAKAFYDALKLLKRLVNIGDAKSLRLPSGFDHASPNVARRAEAGGGFSGFDTA